MTFAFIAQDCPDLPVATCCRVMKVSTSGFYAWLAQPVSDRDLDDAYLTNTIVDIHRMSRGSYRSPRVHAELRLHWWIIITFIPLACIAMAGLGLVLGTSFEPRNIGLMFGFIILPITFLGGTYYTWTRLAPVTVGGWHWLQTVVLVNPLIYVNEGMRAAFTNTPHLHLFVIYPVTLAFAVTFLTIGLRNFRRRVLS